MATAQGASLDRKKLLADPIMVSTIVVLVVFLTLFIIYPLVILLVDSFISDNGFTFDIIKGVLAKSAFRTAIANTLIIGAVTGVLSTLIGLLFAYVEVYVKLRTKFLAGLFKVVSILPVVSPPFVLSLSMILLFGRSGIISKTLLGIQDSNIYGMRSIIIIQTMTFFPVCYMMLKGLLKNIDPSLEEAARDMGASRWKVFTSVTWPLMLPGIGNAFLVTVMESIADFANPMMIGGNVDTLATSIYLQITGNYDKQGAAAMAVVLLSITFIMFFVQKYILEAKATATLSGKASRQRMLITDRSVRVPLVVLCSAVAIFVIAMYICVPYGSVITTWGRNYTLTTKWYEKVFMMYRGAQAFTDSFIMALIAAPLTALLSMIISYLVVKKKFALKGYIELSSMLAMAVPGTVLGVGFIRGYANGLFHTGALQFIYGTTAILIIVFIVRSLPTGTRSGISALRQIDKSIEESAYDMGANSFEVFMTVTLPLIKDSFLSGLVTAFVRSITAISAVILVVTPATLLITVQINEYANRGEYAVACAFSTILILITYAAVLGMNIFIKYFGTSKAQEED
ncbi:MAG: iron ABC transporter permease [Atopobiaceae bacterium]|nr:iron ABC transporter permease [Atopobiaceae bacterium]